MSNSVKPLPAEVEAALILLHRTWRLIPMEERIRFLIEMLTPNERRALQFGFEEDEEDRP